MLVRLGLVFNNRLVKYQRLVLHVSHPFLRVKRHIPAVKVERRHQQIWLIRQLKRVLPEATLELAGVPLDPLLQGHKSSCVIRYLLHLLESLLHYVNQVPFTLVPHSILANLLLLLDEFIAAYFQLRVLIIDFTFVLRQLFLKLHHFS